jgi:hypothetical protein
MRQKRQTELDAAKHDLEIDQLREHVDQVNAVGKEVDERFNKISQRELEIQHSKKIVNELIDSTKKALHQSLGLAAVCLFFTVFGFGLWYWKAQRYQDEATLYNLREQKAKAELAEIELANAKKVACLTPAESSTSAAIPSGAAATPAHP